MSELYQRYAATFLTALADYARVTAALDSETKNAGYITISQRLDVNGSPLIVALAASVDAFYALASGYSGVSLDGMDELAIDAVSELFNVINGHFSSRMHFHAASQVPSVGCTSWQHMRNFLPPNRIDPIFERSLS